MDLGLDLFALLFEQALRLLSPVHIHPHTALAHVAHQRD
jgi:hypothetical protein